MYHGEEVIASSNSPDTMSSFVVFAEKLVACIAGTLHYEVLGGFSFLSETPGRVEASG